MACIYFIRNNTNGKTYIGQTVGTLESRLRSHFQGNTAIDKDLKALGKDNFTWGVLDECLESELDEKEIYYINKYNTYYNGYNNTLGGKLSGAHKLAYIKNNIIQDYKSGMTMNDLNIKYRVGNDTIRNLVKDVDRPTVGIEHNNERTILIGYTKDWTRIGIFESIAEALRFVNAQRSHESKTPVNERNFYRTVKTACVKNGIASGYRWQYAKDVFYQGKQFNSSLDIQRYKLGYKYIVDTDGIIHTADSDMSKKQVHNQYKEENINKLIVTLRNSDYSFSYISTIVGIEQNAVRGRYNRYCKRNSLERYIDNTNNGDIDTAQIVKYIDDGMSLQQISDITHISKDAIRMRYKR